jgi:hypothetical protein
MTDYNKLQDLIQKTLDARSIESDELSLNRSQLLSYIFDNINDADISMVDYSLGNPYLLRPGKYYFVSMNQPTILFKDLRKICRNLVDTKKVDWCELSDKIISFMVSEKTNIKQTS